MSTDLTLIYLNYNTPDWTSLALSSLQRHYLKKTKLNVEVIVVDNASSDGSAELIEKKFSWVKLIRAKENGGFAVGNNLALKQVKSRYVMLINSDVEATKHSNLDQLVYYMDAHPEVSVVTPRLTLTNGKLDPASHRGEPTPWASLTYFSGLAKLFPRSPLLAQYHLSYKDLHHIHEIGACSGAAMLVRTCAMESVGVLDEHFFMYAEDLDWCKRFRDAGGTIVFYPDVQMIHHKYKSGRAQKGVVKSATSKHFYQTMLQYYDKHYRERYSSIVRLGIQLFVWYKTRI